MRARFVSICFSLGLLASTGNAVAEEVLTYAPYSYPPLSVRHGDHVSGYMVDMTVEILKRSGYPFTLEFVPVRRALKLVARRSNVLTNVSLTDRTRKYGTRWPLCFEIAQHALVFKSPREEQTIADLPKDTKIGFFAEYTLKDYLPKQGFSNLVEFSENNQGANMLIADRFDAWATFESAAFHMLRERGEDLTKFKILHLASSPFCIAVSKDTDQKLDAALRTAFDSMLKDGSRQAIRAPYSGILGPDRIQSLDDATPNHPDS